MQWVNIDIFMEYIDFCDKFGHFASSSNRYVVYDGKISQAILHKRKIKNAEIHNLDIISLNLIHNQSLRYSPSTLRRQLSTGRRDPGDGVA